MQWRPQWDTIFDVPENWVEEGAAAVVENKPDWKAAFDEALPQIAEILAERADHDMGDWCYLEN